MTMMGPRPSMGRWTNGSKLESEGREGGESMTSPRQHGMAPGAGLEARTATASETATAWEQSKVHGGQRACGGR